MEDAIRMIREGVRVDDSAMIERGMDAYLALGGDPNSVPGECEIIPLYVCLESPRLTKELLRRGADVNQVCRNPKHYPLMWVAMFAYGRTRSATSLETIELLLSAGINLKHVHHNETVLIRLENEYWDDTLLDLLLRYCRPDDINIVTDTTALHQAVYAGNVTHIEKLLAAGANAHILDGDDHLPLTAAVWCAINIVNDKTYFWGRRPVPSEGLDMIRALAPHYTLDSLTVDGIDNAALIAQYMRNMPPTTQKEILAYLPRGFRRMMSRL